MPGFTWLTGLTVTGLTEGVTAAEAGRIERFTQPAGSYRDSRAREAAVFVPDSYTGQTPVPMVMVLHGCQQTNQNMIDETAFTDLAERDGFIVVFPYITSYDGLRNQNCWGFWFDQHIHEGGGEPEDLYRMALAVEQNFRIDPQRRYVTGLSSGAAMAVVLGVVQSEYFAAIGSVEGLGLWRDAVGGRPVVPVSRHLPHRRTDRRRDPRPADDDGGAAAGAGPGDPFAERLHRQYRGGETHAGFLVAALRVAADAVRAGRLLGRRRRLRAPELRYRPALDLETAFYQGQRGDAAGQGSHYWVGDKSGPFANPQGPSAGALLWAFFQQHPFSPGQAPTVAIASAAANGTTVRVEGSAADADGIGSPGQGAAGRRVAPGGNRGAGDDAVVGGLQWRRERHALYAGRDGGGQ